MTMKPFMNDRRRRPQRLSQTGRPRRQSNNFAVCDRFRISDFHSEFRSPLSLIDPVPMTIVTAASADVMGNRRRICADQEPWPIGLETAASAAIFWWAF
jgi:hypothetical protein